MSHLFFAGLKGPHNVRSRQRTRVLASPRRLLVPSRLQSNSQKLLPVSHVEDAPIPPKIRQKCFKSGVIGDSGDGSRRSGGPSPDSQRGRPSTRQPLHPRGGPGSNQLRYHDASSLLESTMYVSLHRCPRRPGYVRLVRGD